jgi:phage baseplate assembly protein W
MATVVTKTIRKFSDLDLKFIVHPSRKDINKHVDEMAVVYAVKNLVSLNSYEKPFHPEIASNVRRLLFENMDVVTASALQREIQEVIENFEPRARVIDVSVRPDYDRNSFEVTLKFSIVNRTEPIVVTFFLERLR